MELYGATPASESGDGLPRRPEYRAFALWVRSRRPIRDTAADGDGRDWIELPPCRTEDGSRV